jgi:predicted enzyme related to lactoylglutathione lyase
MLSANHHQINYIEFQVKDMKKAQSFYRNAFSWEFKNYSDQYAGILAPEGELGGFVEMEEPKLGGVLVVLYSSKLEDSLQAVKDAGGEICKDIFSFPGGRRFHFLDNTGHELAVWSDQ